MDTTLPEPDRTASSLDRLVAGLQAQLDRSGRFLDTIDPAASGTAFVRIVQLLSERLPDLREAAGLPAEAPPGAARAARRPPLPYLDVEVPSDRVFTFWNQPLDTAPPLVQRCVAQIRRYYPALVVLDGTTVRDRVDIPERIATVLEDDRPAHFSDYVRTRVLAERGGIWFDATSWVGRNFDDDLRGYLVAGTVFPRWSPNHIGNWFIASHPGTPLLTLLRLSLDAWWEATDELPDYFLYHRIFEVLRKLVPEVRGAWRATPTLSSVDAHLLQLEMMQPWRSYRVVDALTASPVQKLSYKYDTVPDGSVLRRLLDGEDLTAGGPTQGP
ncbi:MAG: capsular polysaccharide synthesis protein [Propioniciclava sp.]